MRTVAEIDGKIEEHLNQSDQLKELRKHCSVEGISVSQATGDVSPSREREFKACLLYTSRCV